MRIILHICSLNMLIWDFIKFIANYNAYKTYLIQ
jgi:hypothetical protein